jgi:hypothetical protein
MFVGQTTVMHRTAATASFFQLLPISEVTVTKIQSRPTVAVDPIKAFGPGGTYITAQYPVATSKQKSESTRIVAKALGANTSFVYHSSPNQEKKQSSRLKSDPLRATSFCEYACARALALRVHLPIPIWCYKNPSPFCRQASFKNRSRFGATS